MVETVHESAEQSRSEALPSTGEERKIPDCRHEPPSDHADAHVTRNHLPLTAFKWVAVVLGVLSMLVVAPLVDVVASTLSRLRRLLGDPIFSRR
jgi:hypothetical protein